MEVLGKAIAGRYQIRRPLGENVYSTTFKAYDDRESRPVVVKFLRSEYASDPNLIKRLRLLAARYTSLVHFNLVSCYGFEQAKDYTFWVSDLVEGLNLGEAIQRQPEPCAWEDAVHIAQAVGAALQYAHAQSLYHGDVTPANIIVQSDGSVLLADFGIAASVQVATGGSLMTGTPAYMAPELLAGKSPDARTDIYALAAVLYEMLAGQAPFSGDEAPESIPAEERLSWDKMNSGPLPLGSHGVSIPPLAEAMLLRALSKEPAQRPLTIDSFVSDLSGEELALQYPPTRSIAALVANGDPDDKQETPDMRQAAARLVAFLSNDAVAQANGERTQPAESEANSGPLPAATDETQAADREAPVVQSHFTISWKDIESNRRQAEEWMQAAGEQALQGNWDQVTQICQQVLALEPDHPSARVLAAEAHAHLAGEPGRTLPASEANN